MTVGVVDLRTDGRVEPMGIGSTSPEFAWRLSGGPGQAAFELEVVTEDGAAVWSSGRVASTAPFGHRYGGPGFTSNRRYGWRVRAEQTDGELTDWSETAHFETGLLGADEWRGEWITGGERKKPGTLYFLTELQLPAAPVRARAFASALGWYKLLINADDLTGAALVPRWTPFDHSVEYQAYDATAALIAGTNLIGMVVSEGRYRGRLGGVGLSARYGDRLAALLHLEIELADGTTVIAGTDSGWRIASGPIVSSDPKHGERVDLSRPDPLTSPGAESHPVELLPPHPRRLVAETVERVTETDRRRGTVSRTPSGAQLVDFGQNFSGYAIVDLDGPAGTTVKLSYSEVLTPDGELDTTYLGNREGSEWFQKDEVVLAGAPVRYRPAFTIKGFRYLAVEGLERELTADDVEGVVVTTALRETAQFTCSDPLLERLHENVVWSFRSNFTDTPSDCPTRERSGWTGDLQVFGATAALLADTDQYLRRYLANVETEQLPDGRIPVVIPSETSSFSYGPMDRISRAMSSSVGWGDVAVTLPWTLHRYFGDEDVLRRQYPSGRRWVDFLARRAASRRGLARRFGRRHSRLENYILDSGFHYGEWLRPGESVGAQLRDAIFAPRAVVATAYLAPSARMLARIAEKIGNDADAVELDALADQTTLAWNAAFVTGGGSRIGDDKQDDYVRALAFDLLPEQHRDVALGRLVELIEAADGHLGTGFLSTPMLLPTLSRNGRPDIAFSILRQSTAPSWLAQIERGATTIWETWEGYDEKGKASRSHNHYAFGAVASWLHEDVAGLRPVEPGYRRMRVEPLPGGGLTAASSSVMTPYGRASSSWTVDGGLLRLEIEVPPGTAADVVELGGSVSVAGPGRHAFQWPTASAHP